LGWANLASQWPAPWPRYREPTRVKSDQPGRARAEPMHAPGRSMARAFATLCQMSAPCRAGFFAPGNGQFVVKCSRNAHLAEILLGWQLDEHGLTSISTGFGFCHEICQRFGKSRAKSGYARPSRTGQISVRQTPTAHDVRG
jgi:hypothetical protein